MSSQGEAAKRSRYRAVAALVGISAIWGATFPLVRDGIAGVPTLAFLQIRFLLACLILFSLAARPANGRARLLWDPAAAAPGTLLALGYLLQTAGLRTTGPSVSAFLTGVSVVLVPLFGTMLRWERASVRRSSAALVALAGVYLLQGARMPDRWSRGETWTALCAVAFAAQILLLGRVARSRSDPLALTTAQIAYAAILLLVAGAVRGEIFFLATMPAAAWGAAIFTGCMATALAFFVQTWAQRKLAAGSVAVCFASEPLFAALVSTGFYGDRLGSAAWAGAGLVLVATLLVALDPEISEPASPGS